MKPTIQSEVVKIFAELTQMNHEINQLRWFNFIKKRRLINKYRDKFSELYYYPLSDILGPFMGIVLDLPNKVGKEHIPNQMYSLFEIIGTQYIVFTIGSYDDVDFTAKIYFNSRDKGINLSIATKDGNEYCTEIKYGAKCPNKVLRYFSISTTIIIERIYDAIGYITYAIEENAIVKANT